MNIIRTISAAAIVTAGITGAAGVANAAASASAGPDVSAVRPHRPAYDLTGRGTVTDEGWRLVVHGDAEGRPFGGEWTASLDVAAGRWPEQGECTDGDVSMHLDGPEKRGPHRKEVSVIASGQVCAPDDDGVSAVAYSFVGEFDAYRARPRWLADRQGWIEIVVADDATANLTMLGFR